MIRLITLALCLLLMTGCDLFPQHRVDKTQALYRATLAELDALERQGFLNPNAVSLVFIARYGTSFGRAAILEGRDGATNTPLAAQTMVQYCIEQRQTEQPAKIKACLRALFLRDEDLRYSHGGIAYKIPGQQWYVHQSLRSKVDQQHFQWFGTLQQFIDIALVEHRIQLIVPDTDLQRHLVQKLLVEHAGDDLITPNYNLVAGPFQTHEQMSNQFILEILGAALQPPAWQNTRKNAQGYLRSRGFRPTVILLGGIQSLAKWDQIFPTIDLSQQPYARKYEIGEMITVRSIRQFLLKTGRVSAVREIEI